MQTSLKRERTKPKAAALKKSQPSLEKTKGHKVGIFIRGTPKLLIVGEAPGPRGASVTGFPFWGDVSGVQIYQLFYDLGLMDEHRVKPSKPTRLGFDVTDTPPEGNYAITNAFNQMPWDSNKNKFRAPTPLEIKSQSERLRKEIEQASPHAILAVGLSAARAVDWAMGTHFALPYTGLTEAVLNNIKKKGELAPGKIKLFLTFHPSYGQWKRADTGALHSKIVSLLKKVLIKTSTSDYGF